MLRYIARGLLDKNLRYYYGIRLYELGSGPVEVHYDLPRLGLFAHLTLIAALAMRLGERDRPFGVKCFNDSYRGAHREDWFGHLFDDLQPRRDSGQLVTLRRMAHTPNHWRGRSMKIEEAGYWFSRKFSPKTEILSTVDKFVTSHFRDSRVLAVHYRGTDKTSEARRASYDEVLACINARMERESYDLIFLATDEAAFVEYMQRSPHRVLLQANALRATDGKALHLPGDGLGLRKAKEALVDCLLLSRCHGLVKTASILSGWAVVFNPSLKVDFINPPNAKTSHFPEPEILRRIAQN